jgi:hypothetical protein
MIARLRFRFTGISVVFLGLSGCMCQHHVRSEAMSPDRRFVATHYESNCGATTGFVTTVAIRPASSSFEHRRRDAVFVANGQGNIGLRWSEMRELTITLPPAHPVRRLQQWEDIRVRYAHTGE